MLEAITAPGISVGAAELALTALDRPIDKNLDYALWLTMRELHGQWMPALQQGRSDYGGQTHRLSGENTPRYLTIYEIDSPEVLASKAWADAGELGRWPGEVRPFTHNRHHVLRKVLSDET